MKNFIGLYCLPNMIRFSKYGKFQWTGCVVRREIIARLDKLEERLEETFLVGTPEWERIINMHVKKIID